MIAMQIDECQVTMRPVRSIVPTFSYQMLLPLLLLARFLEAILIAAFAPVRVRQFFAHRLAEYQIFATYCI